MLMGDLPGFSNLGFMPFTPSSPDFLSQLLLLLWLLLTPVPVKQLFPWYSNKLEQLNLALYLHDTAVCELSELALVEFLLSFFFPFLSYFSFSMPTVDCNIFNMVMSVQYPECSQLPVLLYPGTCQFLSAVPSTLQQCVAAGRLSSALLSPSPPHSTTAAASGRVLSQQVFPTLHVLLKFLA